MDLMNILLAILIIAIIALIAYLIPALYEIKKSAKALTHTLTTIENGIEPLCSKAKEILDDAKEIADVSKKNMGKVDNLIDSIQNNMKAWTRVSGAIYDEIGRPLLNASYAIRAFKKGLRVFLYAMEKTMSGAKKQRE